jgi:hypothetical protein
MEVEKQVLAQSALMLRILPDGHVLEQSLKYHTMIRNIEGKALRRQDPGNIDIQLLIY